MAALYKLGGALPRLRLPGAAAQCHNGNTEEFLPRERAANSENRVRLDGRCSRAEKLGLDMETPEAMTSITSRERMRARAALTDDFFREDR